jgi:hypothetical protein
MWGIISSGLYAGRSIPLARPRLIPPFGSHRESHVRSTMEQQRVVYPGIMVLNAVPQIGSFIMMAFHSARRSIASGKVGINRSEKQPGVKADNHQSIYDEI